MHTWNPLVACFERLVTYSALLVSHGEQGKENKDLRVRKNCSFEALANLRVQFDGQLEDLALPLCDLEVNRLS